MRFPGPLLLASALLLVAPLALAEAKDNATQGTSLPANGAAADGSPVVALLLFGILAVVIVVFLAALPPRG